MSVVLPRWPKGPFPERYRWDPVAERLKDAWSEPRRAAALARLLEGGWTPDASYEDPWVRVLRPKSSDPEPSPDPEHSPEPALDSLFAELAMDGITAFRWDPPQGEPATPGAIALVASDDPVDAIVAVGVSGPRHGVGVAALVRYTVAIRGLTRFGIHTAGEERVVLSLDPPTELVRLRIAERALRVCPPLGRTGISIEALAASIAETHLLDLTYR